MVRQAVESSLRDTRACEHASAFAGFDGATFTNAPNAGVDLRSPLKPSTSAGEIGAEVHDRARASGWPRSPGRDVLVIAAAAGAGHRHRRRLQDDDRGPRRAGYRGARERPRAMMIAAANQEPALTSVFTPVQHRDAAALRRHRPRRRPRWLGVPLDECLRDARHLSRLGLRQRLQLPRPHLPGDGAGRRALPRRRLPTSRGCRRARRSGAMVPLGSVADVQRRQPAPTACVRYNLYPGRRGAGRRRARLSPPARRSRRWSRWPREVLPEGFGYRMDRARLPAEAGGQHRRDRLRPGGGLRLPAAGGAVREPGAAAGGDPDRADVPAGRHARRQPARAWTTTS